MPDGTQLTQCSCLQACKNFKCLVRLQVAELAMQALESGRFLVKAPDAATSLMIAAGATHPRMNSWPVEMLLAPFYIIMYMFMGSYFDRRILRWRRELWSDSRKLAFD